MRDSDLTERPGKGWTPWAKGPGDHDIEKVWWAARVLHHPKLNVSTWFDGSELVGISHWGYRGEKWTMKQKPADWQPLPDKFKRERERAQQEALERVRIAAEARMLARIQATGKRQSTPDVGAEETRAGGLPCGRLSSLGLFDLQQQPSPRESDERTDQPHSSSSSPR